MKLDDYDVGNPYNATVKETHRITPDTIDVEVRHIILAVEHSAFHYIEGQSIGLLVPGPHEFGNPHHFRLYSIANARNGEKGDSTYLSICVRRCFYVDEISGERYPGVASNYLCDRRAGDIIQITGPYGAHFSIPKDNQSNILMIGVGTGIAPFRAFTKHIYDERKTWKGKVRLFYGARTGMELLYMNDVMNDFTQYYDNQTFKAFESLNARPAFDDVPPVGETLEEHATEVWDLIEDPKTHVYITGMSVLTERLDTALSRIAGSEEVWTQTKEHLKKENRWSELLY